MNKIDILTTSKTPPFLIADDAGCSEDLRLTYRYLDIRRNPIKDGLLLRNAVTQLTRNYLNGLNFCEVETPILIKSTPEGARDFVVPSRLNAGQWYALPQSPQTFKQILMVSGMDRYFQIAKCFRDEDLRPDRQVPSHLHGIVIVVSSYSPRYTSFAVLFCCGHHLFLTSWSLRKSTAKCRS